MKKPLTIALALVACIAIVISCVFGVQKGNIQKAADEAQAALNTKVSELDGKVSELESAKADLEKQMADAAAEAEGTLAGVRTELEGKVSELEGVKADLEKQMADAAAEAEETLAGMRTELESKVSELEAAKAELENKVSELEAAKAELENSLKETTEKAASVQAELEEKVAGLEAELVKTRRAVTAAKSNAYIMYANADWSIQNWGTEDSEDGTVLVNPANVVGEGDYTVSLEFATPAQGLAFTAVGINRGEADFPGAFIRINEIRVNGEAIEFKQGYTSSDDGKVTRMNIYNEWVTELPEDAHAFDGNLEEAGAIIVDKEAFASVSKFEVDFSLLTAPIDHAYIMYADSAWTMQNWGIVDSEDGNVKVTSAEIKGAGAYSVALDFATPAEGLAFAALGIQHGEKTYPNYFITINEIRVNGEKIEALEGKKGYTSSDNGIETRMNIYNEWVTELPEDARSLDGDLSNAAPIFVNVENFASVSKIEIDFTFEPVSAYLMFANPDWTIQNWGYASTEAVKVQTAPITGEGTYQTSLEFATPVDGIAFMALGVKNGEKMLPNAILQIDRISINEQDVPLTAKSYTSSDDGLETRANIYNEWVTDLPTDARADGGLTACAPIIVDPAAFSGVHQILVEFRVLKGAEAPAAPAADDSMSKEEADALKEAGFHAYIGVQGKDTYVFRNAWNDSYGLNDETNPFFNRLTGWDEANNAVDYGGTFEDVEIKGDGEYTVSLTTGEMGFGTTSAFNLLFASTDIPSRLVTEGYLTISDVKIKVGSGATQEYTELNTEGDYVRITALDVYNQTAEPFGYTVPGAGETISITFTVSGW